MLLFYCRWSKREEQDFVRVISFFGVIFNPKANKYNWTRFRYDQQSNLYSIVTVRKG